MLGSSRVVAQLAASQEGLSSMRLVMHDRSLKVAVQGPAVGPSLYTTTTVVNC
jgi:hypothetical protein